VGIFKERRQSIMLQVVVGNQRHWVEINYYDAYNKPLYTMHLLGQDLMGEAAHAEASNLKELFVKFARRWEEWNECGPW
jgi:hypothetical protein